MEISGGRTSGEDKDRATAFGGADAGSAAAGAADFGARTEPGTLPPTGPGAPSPVAAAWRRLIRNRGAVFGMAVICAMGLAALAAPLLSPYSYWDGVPGCERLGPRPGFWLGTDMLGRDVLSRMMYGARISLAVGIAATALSLVIGLSVGLTAGYSRGILDAVLMRVTDTVYAFPGILLAVGIAAIAEKPSPWIAFVALGLSGWTGIARVTRAETMKLAGADYVLAARALGVPTLRILWRHILPNALSPVMVMATLAIGGNILGEAALSFLGLGAEDPYPSWGGMLAEARDHFTVYWWMGVFPGLAIVLTVLAFNMIGDGLRDALDVRSGGAPY
ncbi:MAG: ABC transporter permease [Planctomycetota bacterium]|nr:ABC transporter permease [Planctomycetota bacterium]